MKCKYCKNTHSKEYKCIEYHKTFNTGVLTEEQARQKYNGSTITGKDFKRSE